MSGGCPDENEIVAFADGALPAQRRDAIAAHIDGCDECRTLAAEAVDDEDVARPPKKLVRGDAVGRFVVIDRVGAGGLGEVFLAYDPELDRRIAIKLLRAATAVHEELHARLVREARAMAKLAHPNVVHVYDVGRQDGRVFIAMEYVEGPTLRTWVDDAARGWTEVRDLFVQAGEGLQAAHDRGIVHRDFKPSNVLIGEEGRARVVDFGLAAAPEGESRPAELKSSAGADEDLTLTGTILGTPAYMAPEQHRAGTVDARADQFAFCVALFEALYGVRPFGGKDLASLEHAKLSAEIQEARRRDRPPPWLRKVVMRGLSPEPEDRYASMTDLLLDLTADQRRRRTARTVLGIALGVAALGGAFGVGTWVTTPSADLQAQINDLESRAREAAAAGHFILAPNQTETAYDLIRTLEQLEDPTGTATEVATTLRQEFATQLQANPDTYAIALAFNPDTPRPRVAQEPPSAPPKVAEHVPPAEIQPTVEKKPVTNPSPSPRPKPNPEPATPPPPAVDRELAKKEAAAGKAHLRAHRFGEAEKAFHRALAADAKHVGALEGLAELHFEQGHYGKAVKFGRQAVRLRPRWANLRVQLGDAYFKTLRYEDARREYERARDLGHAGAKARLAQLQKKLGDR